MKNIFRIFLALLFLGGVVSCSDDDASARYVPLTINGGESFLSLDRLARTGNLVVKADAPWFVTTAATADWLTLSTRSGDSGTSEIVLGLAENEGPARSAVLAFSCGNAVISFRVSQAGAHVGFQDTDYDFYYVLGTMPALYAGLYVLQSDKPSWIYYERGNTFDAAEFPAWVEVLNLPDAAENGSFANKVRMRDEMMRRVKALNAADPTAVFGLYVDDLRCRQGYDWFAGQGIDSARVKVTLLSDGTATYNNYFNYFGDPATAQQNWERFAGEVEALDWNHGGLWPETRGENEDAKIDSWTWAFYMATLPGYRLVMQDGGLLETTSPYMEERLAQMHIENVKPYELLESLPADRQDEFYRMAKFDYAHFAGMFDASAKKNLIIIGTNPGGAAQRNYVGEVMELYGSEYDVFFKPHPADTSSADYETRFPGLKLLPGQMPFEIFVWALLPKIDVIGGYPSTTYLTVPVDKVGFIFAPNAASLVRPLNLLFANAENVRWIWD